MVGRRRMGGWEDGIFVVNVDVADSTDGSIHRPLDFFKTSVDAGYLIDILEY